MIEIVMAAILLAGGIILNQKIKTLRDDITRLSADIFKLEGCDEFNVNTRVLHERLVISFSQLTKQVGTLEKFVNLPKYIVREGEVK